MLTGPIRLEERVWDGVAEQATTALNTGAAETLELIGGDGEMHVTPGAVRVASDVIFA
jgi:hypothetical protein